MKISQKQISLAKAALWRTGNLSFKLHPGQLEIYNQIKTSIDSGQKEFALRVARQYGKSYLIVILALEMCLQHSGIIVRILGPTLDSIKNIVEDNLAPIIQDAPRGLIRRMKTDKRYTVGKSSLRIGTVERAHIDASARGGNAFCIFIEECAASVKSEDLKYAIESIVNPQLLRSSKEQGGGLLGYITTPAPVATHYFHSVIEPPLQAIGAYWSRTVYENPQLTPEQVALAMQRCGGELSEAWRREYLCEIFRSESIMIVPEFSERHIVDFELPEHRRLYTCLDGGGSKDCSCALLCHWNLEDKKLYISNEVFATPQTPSVKFIAGIKEMESVDSFGPVFRVGDLPGQLSVDYNQTMQFTIQQTAKDNADVALQNIRNMFYRDEIVIHPRCTMLIRTLNEGQWNNSRTDFMRTPDLGHSDAIDALIYAARNIDKTECRPEMKPREDQFNRRRPQISGFQKLAESWK